MIHNDSTLSLDCVYIYLVSTSQPFYDKTNEMSLPSVNEEKKYQSNTRYDNTYERRFERT